MSKWVIMVMRPWAQKLQAKPQVCTAALDHVEAVAQTRITGQNDRSSGVTAAPKVKLLVLGMITKQWKHQQSHQQAERKLSMLRSGQVLEPSEPRLFVEQDSVRCTEARLLGRLPVLTKYMTKNMRYENMHSVQVHLA